VKTLQGENDSLKKNIATLTNKINAAKSALS
jgi:hypothetical protein